MAFEPDIIITIFRAMVTFLIPIFFWKMIVFLFLLLYMYVFSCVLFT